MRATASSGSDAPLCFPYPAASNDGWIAYRGPADKAAWKTGIQAMFDAIELIVGIALIGAMALYAYACQRL
jgi:hypothetical protein